MPAASRKLAIPSTIRRALQGALLDWFAVAQRPLPWRERYDPYAVWVAEMMLQQTQVETVKPYFARWMEHFPNVSALASAPQQEALKLWEGMGYYARARNLHSAAREVMARHGGEVPADPEALRALPGIGRYSTGAIGSIAFNLPLPVVDGNVTRVLSRWFALNTRPGEAESPAGKAAMWELAEALIPPGRARDFNQALMELGALICRARQPLCGLCPVRDHCRGYAEGRPDAYPAAKIRKARAAVAALLVVAEHGGKVLLRRRPPRGLWGGLWEFPWIEARARDGHALERLLASLDLRAIGGARPLGQVRHGLTHREFAWRCVALKAKPSRGKRTNGNQAEGAELRWADAKTLTELPLGRPMHKVLALLDGATSENRY